MRGDLIGDFLPAEMFDQLPGLPQIEVAVQEGIAVAIAAQNQHRHHGKQARRDRAHRRQPGHAKGFQAIEQGVHARLVHGARCSVRLDLGGQ